jgi:hypothetical protein
MPDEELRERRNGILSYLMEAWPEIGWTLMHARTRVDIRAAFSLTAPADYLRYLLTPLMRSVDVPVSRPELDKARRARADMVNREQRLDELRRLCEEEAAQTTRALASPGAVESVTLEEESRRARQRLQDTLHDLSSLRDTRARMDAEIDIYEAAVVQDELLRFLASPKYQVTPWHLACALAGVPRLTWAHSLRKARTVEEREYVPVRVEYDVFLLIERCLKRRPFASLLDELRHTIRRLPEPRPPTTNHPVSPQEHRETNLRQHVIEYWRYLRLAVECACTCGETPQARLPFLIASGFKRGRLQRMHAAETVLAAREARDLSAQLSRVSARTHSPGKAARHTVK